MANIFKQANLLIEATTKQGTSQCTKIKARAAEAGRKLREFNRLHQRIILGQQAQAEPDETIAGESQSIWLERWARGPSASSSEKMQSSSSPSEGASGAR
jgi:hypothetical protein